VGLGVGVEVGAALEGDGDGTSDGAGEPDELGCGVGLGDGGDVASTARASLDVTLLAAADAAMRLIATIAANEIASPRLISATTEHGNASALSRLCIQILRRSGQLRLFARH
jgi:hypothetical protein